MQEECSEGEHVVNMQQVVINDSYEEGAHSIGTVDPLMVDPLLVYDNLHEARAEAETNSGRRVKRKCCAPECSNSNLTSLLHTFPSNVERCKLWLTNIGNASLMDIPAGDLYQKFYVCSAHFDKNQYCGSSLKVLKTCAIPTKALNMQNECSDDRDVMNMQQVEINNSYQGCADPNDTSNGVRVVRNNPQRVKRKCCVPKCRNTNMTSTLHTFPSDVERCKLWLTSIGNESLFHIPVKDLHQKCHVCSAHFGKDQYCNGRSKVLKRCAIPTKALNMQTECPEDETVVSMLQMLLTDFSRGRGRRKCRNWRSGKRYVGKARYYAEIKASRAISESSDLSDSMEGSSRQHSTIIYAPVPVEEQPTLKEAFVKEKEPALGEGFVEEEPTLKEAFVKHEPALGETFVEEEPTLGEQQKKKTCEKRGRRKRRNWRRSKRYVGIARQYAERKARRAISESNRLPDSMEESSRQHFGIIYARATVEGESTLEEALFEQEPALGEVFVKDEPILGEVFVKDEPILGEVFVKDEPILGEVFVEEEQILGEAFVKDEPILGEAFVEEEPILGEAFIEDERTLGEAFVIEKPALPAPAGQSAHMEVSVPIIRPARIGPEATTVMGPVRSVRDRLESVIRSALPSPWMVRVSTVGLHCFRISEQENCSVQRCISFTGAGDRGNMFVHMEELPIDHEVHAFLPSPDFEHSTVDEVSSAVVKAVERVEQYSVCWGQQYYEDLWSKFPQSTIDNNRFGETSYKRTLRSSTCRLLVLPTAGVVSACSPCKILGAALRKAHSRISNFDAV